MEPNISTTLNSERFGGLLANGGYSGKRRELDYYPTPPEVTTALMNFLRLEPCSIWECACGDGSMSKVLEQYGHEVYSTDIRHTGFGHGGVDYLNMKYSLICDAIITNPPFHSAHLFIQKALEEASLVAMLLKSQYWHAQKRAKLYRDNPPAWVLPLTWRPDFMNGEAGGKPTMECLWTVWIRGDYTPIYHPLPKP